MIRYFLFEGGGFELESSHTKQVLETLLKAYPDSREVEKVEYDRAEAKMAATQGGTITTRRKV